MKTLIVILKRRLLSPAFIVLFIISVFAVPFISSLGGDTLFPPAGFFLEGDDDTVHRPVVEDNVVREYGQEHDIKIRMRLDIVKKAAKL